MSLYLRNIERIRFGLLSKHINTAFFIRCESIKMLSIMQTAFEHIYLEAKVYNRLQSGEKKMLQVIKTIEIQPNALKCVASFLQFFVAVRITYSHEKKHVYLDRRIFQGLTFSLVYIRADVSNQQHYIYIFCINSF